MRYTNFKYLVSDFETTVYDEQEFTEVWASATVELYTEDVHIFHSIEEQLNYYISLNQNLIVFFHNLKFDGSFWLDYLLNNEEYKQGYYPVTKKFKEVNKLRDREFVYLISDMGQFYTISIKVGKYTIELRDSLKLLPFSVDTLGKSFDTKHRKLDMEYKGFRYAGCKITEKERKYIANDVLVVKEAIEYMFNAKHKRLTIGSCCFAEFKKYYGEDYDNYFPQLADIKIDKEKYGYETAEEYIRKSYHGGWCYVVKGKENQVFKNGCTADVNSLYPSQMHSESGNYYPVGKPHFWKGDFIPTEALKGYYFIRIKTRFELRKNYLPTIQVKGNLSYMPTEYLETSNIYSYVDGKYHSTYRDYDGVVKPATVEMVLTMIDYELIKEHYVLSDTVILDGCWFYKEIGLFDFYINKYRELKVNAKNKGQRTLAKLFLNNLYGKFATSTKSSFKRAYLKENGAVGFETIEKYEKEAGYIAIGSAITSYARNFTIRHAQKNYYGKEKRGFIYADTDSIHCDLNPNELVDIKIHYSNFNCWKIETQWDRGLFVRQKTYIEDVNTIDGEKLDKNVFNIVCAGMPDRCKELFAMSVRGEVPKDLKKPLNETEQEFVNTKREMSDFKLGICVPSKLLTTRIKGGILLKDSCYNMR